MKFWALLKREWLRVGRRPGDTALPVLFFIVSVTIFGMGFAPNDPAFVELLAGLLWVVVILSALISADRPYRDDFVDGVFEQWQVAGVPLWQAMLAKVTAHWTVTGLPLTLVAPAVGWLLGLDVGAALVLLFSLALGSIAIIAIVGFVAALTLIVARPNLLQPLLILPLTMPLVIFGTAAVRAASVGLPVSGPLYFVAALCVLSVTLVPPGAAHAVREAMDA